MSTRILPRAEWGKLAGTEAEPVVPYLEALGGRALAVEDQAGTVVGTWLLLPEWRAECLWIAPAHRGKSAVARRLWAGLRRVARELGVSHVVTGAVTKDVEALLIHVGAQPLPGRHYVMPMGGQ
jgi:hypothetical protein